MTRKILVSGGLGFIGHHLCGRLLAREANCSITIIDDLSSAILPYPHLSQRARVIISDFRSVPSDLGPFDEIYHLASPVGSLGILEKHGRIAVEILELANVAARIARRSAARLLYVSSSEVYGSEERQDEAADQIVPCRRGSRMEYALGKLTGEHMLLNLASEGRFEVRIVRPFNAMGAGQNSRLGFVIPRFFESALAGEDLLVHGNGCQLRSFCHVDDLADGILAVQNLGRAGEIYNVGNPDNRISIVDLAKMIRSICRSSSRIRHVDPHALYGSNFIEAFDKIPETVKVAEHTGWVPSIDLEQGLDRILSYYGTLPSHDLRTHAIAAQRG